ncbi:hypothetical protein [Janibacter anophelis]|uniref:hypothetical protein n=1 Tax=Janibacter anophelis TaxID=319054 RepID=UPI000DEEF18B|nr:hypothetical protein [Janibacter anophelis]
MDGSQMSGLALLLTTIGSGVAWLVVRWDKRRPKVSRQAALTAHASEAVTGALATVQQSLSDDLTRVRRDAEEDREQHRRDRDADRARMDSLSGEVEALRREVQVLRAAWATWYRDLVDRWHIHRAQAAPPAPPNLD